MPMACPSAPSMTVNPLRKADDANLNPNMRTDGKLNHHRLQQPFVCV